MGVAAWAAAAPGGDLYILQDNDVDPTAPSSQVGGRWYHWMGVDPVVTHLETGMAIDAGAYRGILEVNQDLTDLRALEGEQALPGW